MGDQEMPCVARRETENGGVKVRPLAPLTTDVITGLVIVIVIAILIATLLGG